MAGLNRESFLLKSSRRIEEVKIPEDFPLSTYAGQSAYVRSLTALERGEFDARIYLDDGSIDRARYRVELIYSCACDDAGNRIFTPDDVEAIESLDSALTQLLSEAAAKMIATGAVAEKN